MPLYSRSLLFSLASCTKKDWLRIYSITLGIDGAYLSWSGHSAAAAFIDDLDTYMSETDCQESSLAQLMEAFVYTQKHQSASELLSRYQTGQPTVLFTSLRAHSITLIFVNGYLVIGNKAAPSMRDQGGTVVFKLKEELALDEETVKSLSSIEFFDDLYDIVMGLCEEPEPVSGFAYLTRFQKYGNCTYTNKKAALVGAIGVMQEAESGEKSFSELSPESRRIAKSLVGDFTHHTRMKRVKQLCEHINKGTDPEFEQLFVQFIISHHDVDKPQEMVQLAIAARALSHQSKDSIVDKLAQNTDDPQCIIGYAVFLAINQGVPVEAVSDQALRIIAEIDELDTKTKVLVQHVLKGNLGYLGPRGDSVLSDYERQCHYIQSTVEEPVLRTKLYEYMLIRALQAGSVMSPVLTRYLVENPSVTLDLNRAQPLLEGKSIADFVYSNKLQVNCQSIFFQSGKLPVTEQYLQNAVKGVDSASRIELILLQRPAFIEKKDFLEAIAQESTLLPSVYDNLVDSFGEEILLQRLEEVYTDNKAIREVFFKEFTFDCFEQPSQGLIALHSRLKALSEPKLKR